MEQIPLPSLESSYCETHAGSVVLVQEAENPERTVESVNKNITRFPLRRHSGWLC